MTTPYNRHAPDARRTYSFDELGEIGAVENPDGSRTRVVHEEHSKNRVRFLALHRQVHRLGEFETLAVVRFPESAVPRLAELLTEAAAWCQS